MPGMSAGGGGMEMGMAPGMMGGSMSVQNAEKQLLVQLIQQLRGRLGSKGANREKVEKQLKLALQQYFATDMEERVKEFDKVKARLAEMESKLQRRLDNEGEIVELQLKQMLHKADGLDFSVPGGNGMGAGYGGMGSMGGYGGMGGEGGPGDRTVRIVPSEAAVGIASVAKSTKRMQIPTLPFAWTNLVQVVSVPKDPLQREDPFASAHPRPGQPCKCDNRQLNRAHGRPMPKAHSHRQLLPRNSMSPRPVQRPAGFRIHGM